jgi:hypothetical protein
VNFATDNMNHEFSTKWDLKSPLTSCRYVECIFYQLVIVYYDKIYLTVLAYASSKTSPKFY